MMQARARPPSLGLGRERITSTTDQTQCGPNRFTDRWKLEPTQEIVRWCGRRGVDLARPEVEVYASTESSLPLVDR